MLDLNAAHIYVLIRTERISKRQWPVVACHATFHMTRDWSSWPFVVINTVAAPGLASESFAPVHFTNEASTAVSPTGIPAFVALGLNEKDWKEAEEIIKHEGIKATAWRDPDHPELGITAYATWPLEHSQRKWFKSFRLLPE